MSFASTILVSPEKHLLRIADRFGRILYCVHSTQYSLLVFLVTRPEAIASLSIGFTLWRILTVLTRSAITPPEVKRFRWKLGHSEYIVCHWDWQGTHCRHLSNYIEPSVYSGDAPYVKLLWPLVIFGRPLRQSHKKPSASSRVLYCGHSTKYSHLV